MKREDIVIGTKRPLSHGAVFNVEEKRKEQEEMSMAVELFVKNGGVIQKVESGVLGDKGKQ